MTCVLSNLRLSHRREVGAALTLKSHAHLAYRMLTARLAIGSISNSRARALRLRVRWKLLWRDSHEKGMRSAQSWRTARICWREPFRLYLLSSFKGVWPEAFRSRSALLCSRSCHTWRLEPYCLRYHVGNRWAHRAAAKLMTRSSPEQCYDLLV